MKYIKVNLRGRFRQDFSNPSGNYLDVRRGKEVKVDLLKAWNGLSGIACRVTNLRGDAAGWWDAAWFDFVPKK